MSSALIRFSLFKTQGRAQPNRAVPVCSILKLIVVIKSLKFCLASLSEGSVQHGQRLACPHGFSPRVVLTRPPPLRDSVAGRKCSMPSASHSPGGCRPPVGVVPRWLLVRGCRMRTLTCSVFKVRMISERTPPVLFSACYSAQGKGRMICPFTL